MQTTCGIDSIKDALEACGAGPETLSPAEKRSLDEEGYVLFEGLIEPDWLDALRLRFDELAKKEGAAAGLDYHQEPGALRIGNLVNKGEVFDRIYTHPKYLAAVHYILRGEFHLSA